MSKGRRGRIQKQRTNWTVEEWKRGWELAMMRIEGVPSIVRQQPVFCSTLAVLDKAFIAGDTCDFERGLSTLLHLCAGVVNRGVCKQWWPDE